MLCGPLLSKSCLLLDPDGLVRWGMPEASSMWRSPRFQFLVGYPGRQDEAMGAKVGWMVGLLFNSTTV